MAKAKKNGSHLVNDIAPDAPETLSDADVVEEKPPLTTEELNAMFDAVDSYDGKVAALNAELETLKAGRSDAVKAIVDAVGNKGPWDIGGKRISVTERGGRFNMQRESAARLTLNR